MLRSITSHQLAPRIIAFKVNIDTDTSTSSILDGNDDVASISYVSTGIIDVTFKEPFSRTPVGLANAVADGARAAVLQGANTTLAGCRVAITNAAGTAADGDAHVMICGWDSGFTSNNQPRRHVVKSTRVKPRLLALNLTVNSGTDFVTTGKYDIGLSQDGTGVFTITYRDAFASAPIIVGCANGSADTVHITSSAVDTAVIHTTDDSGVASDPDFYLFVLGWDTVASAGTRRIPMQSTQRKMRLVPWQLTVAAGTPTVAIGSELVSVDDDGVGDFGVNFTQNFTRTTSITVVTPNETAGDIAYVTSSSNAATEVDVADNGASPSDTGIDGITIGFDVSDEYNAVVSSATPSPLPA